MQGFRAPDGASTEPMRDTPASERGGGAAGSAPSRSVEIVSAGPQHLEAVIAAVKAAPIAVSPLRPWSREVVREWLVPLVRSRWQPMLDDPAYEALLELDGDKVNGWIVLQHETVEGATGHPQTTIIPPSHVTTPALLEEAMRRSEARGSKIVSGNVLVDDAVQNACYREAGLVAEFQRIILPLKQGWRDTIADKRVKAAFERASASLVVRRADLTDRLSILRLAGECVNMMFHARRDEEEVQLIQGRFIDAYANLDMDDKNHHVWIAETPDQDLCGALQIDARRDHLIDGAWQGYISDISVLPDHWGRAVGVALVCRGIDALVEEGIKYLAGDISTTNERVWALSQKFGFELESFHYVGRVGGEKP